GIPAASAGTLSEVAGFGSNPGNLKMFKYIPDRLRDPAPLVVVLHGCNQSAGGYYEHSGWAKYADQGGFALLLPEQKAGLGPLLPDFPGLDTRNHPTRCFNFAELRDSRRGSGEALSIRQMIDRMKIEAGIDDKRIFVTGLSAGGGMTAVMLATYPEVFAGGGIVAGLPYRCGTATLTAEMDCGVTLANRPHRTAPDRTPAAWGDLVRQAAPQHQGPWPRVSIWQGTADGTVDPLNARELVEQWTNVHGIDQAADETESGANVTRRVFRNTQGTALVESFELRGFGHATPIDPDGRDEACGSLGDSFIVDGNICSSHRIARFWGLLGEPPTVTIAEAVVQGTTLSVSGTASDRDGTVTAVAVHLEGRSPRPAVRAQGTAKWSASFADLDDNTSYTPVVTAIDDAGLLATTTGTPVSLGTVANSPPDVVISVARGEQDCLSVNGVATDRDGRVTDVAVKLGTREFRPARLRQDQYRFRECRLPNGSYTVQVRAKDNLGATGDAHAEAVEISSVVS
ncbi:MAG TPA: PHB depolymerase family esterase, partial [Beijerinckiaceae bacterium]|nr:PHB depolymerase family esterase [Beijerinckiaceae bacterium]